MKRLAIIPAFACECVCVAFDFCAAVFLALAEYFYNFNGTKRDLRDCDEDAN